MAKTMGALQRDFCPVCRESGVGPDCPVRSVSRTARRRAEKAQWMRDYLSDAADFDDLRHRTGWFFLGSWAWYWENRCGDLYNEAYAEFGVTESGFPVRRRP